MAVAFGPIVGGWAGDIVASAAAAAYLVRMPAPWRSWSPFQATRRVWRRTGGPGTPDVRALAPTGRRAKAVGGTPDARTGVRSRRGTRDAPGEIRVPHRDLCGRGLRSVRRSGHKAGVVRGRDQRALCRAAVAPLADPLPALWCSIASAVALDTLVPPEVQEMRYAHQLEAGRAIAAAACRSRKR